jgi:hypothetical protein
VQISIEQLVASIVREVVSELVRRGVTVTGGMHYAPAPATTGRGSPAQAGPAAAPSPAAGTLEIDMSGYRTPILTEDYLIRLAPSVSTLIVPCSTVLTPGARDLIRKKKLSIVRNAQSH